MNNGKIWKLLWAFVALLSLVVIVWYSIGLVSLGENEEKKAAEEYLKDYYESYEDDPYGGDTPEETIALFIDALEKGDIELASKYFIPEKEEESNRKIQDLQTQGNLANFIAYIKILGNKYSLIENDNTQYIFEAFDEKDKLVLQLYVGIGLNGKWKIIDM